MTIDQAAAMAQDGWISDTQAGLSRRVDLIATRPANDVSSLLFSVLSDIPTEVRHGHLAKGHDGTFSHRIQDDLIRGRWNTCDTATHGRFVPFLDSSFCRQEG